MKKFFSALALAAMILFPLALQAKTVTFTTNLPEAFSLSQFNSSNYSSVYYHFEGKESITVDLIESAGVQINVNSGYEFVGATVDGNPISLSSYSLYIQPDNMPEGCTVALTAKEKEPRVFTVSADPEQVSISFGGTKYTAADMVDGKWTFSDISDYGQYLEIECVTGYVIESMTNNATGSEVLSSYYLFKQTASYQLSPYEFPNGANFTITATTLASVRTLHVSLEVVDGEDNQISVRRYGEYNDIPSTEWNNIALNPKSELPLYISSRQATPIYKVTVNNEVVTSSGGSYSLNDLPEGAKIKVWPNFPDVDVPVKFVFVNKGTEGAIKQVDVNGTPQDKSVWSAEDFSIKLGSTLGITGNTEGFNISSIKWNGDNKSVNGFSESVISDQPITITVDADKYRDYTVTLYYEPGTINAYNSYGTSNPIDLPADGSVELTIPRGQNNINIVAADGYRIVSIEDASGNALRMPLTINDDMEISVYTEKFDRDNTCVLYLAPSGEAGGSWNYAMVMLSQTDDALRQQINPEVGYNFIKYNDADRPIYLSFYPNADVYLNDEKCVNEYGVWSGMSTMEPNSVIKVFPANTEVPTYTLTIDNQSDGGVEILADYIKPLEGTAATVLGATDVEFVTISSAAAEGQTAYIIKVNGEDVKAGEDGKTVAHIEADSTISIAVDPSSSINEITAEGNSPIYNLQGVRVQNPRSGIFIQNGRKVIR